MDQVWVEFLKLFPQGAGEECGQRICPQRAPAKERLHEGCRVAEAVYLRPRNEAEMILVYWGLILVGSTQGEHSDLVVAAELLCEGAEHEPEAVDGREGSLDCTDEDSHPFLSRA